MKSLFMKKAERECGIWIKNCTESDAPRLASEVYPADVRIDEDVNWSGDSLNLTLDYYRPFNVDSSKECFLLIHGGAFVYGSKVLDKCFGMHLAKYSGIPVANMDYTLMPQAGLSKILGQIFSCMNFLTEKYGIEKFHLTGDSAGGYLALLSALAARNSHIAHDLWIFEKPKGQVLSAGLICGGITDVVWHYLPAEKAAIFGVYEILPAFIVCLAVTMIVSLCTKPDDEVLSKFDEYKTIED